jgi:hypothetical protein
MATGTRRSRARPIGITILDQLASLDGGSLSAATARELLAIRFNSKQRARVKALLAKAREGQLSGARQDELDEYLHVADQLAILHSKARQALRKPGKAL